jgi:MFS family permease
MLTFFLKGLFIPFFYIVDYAHSLSFSLSPPSTTTGLDFLVLSILNLGGLFGRILPAYLSDRAGRFNILFPSSLLSGLFVLLLWTFAKSITSVMIFAALYGFASGAFISVVTPCVAQISEMGEIGSRIGGLYMGISFP